MIFNRPKYHTIVVAVVAAVLTLPVPALAQTAPAATSPSPTAPQPAPATPATNPAAAPAVAPAVDSPVTAQASNSPDFALKLPRDLSPWGMFMAADIVVKAVMIGLAFASVLTWTIWFAKAIELMMVRRRMQATIEALSQARSWNEATSRIKGPDSES